MASINVRMLGFKAFCWLTYFLSLIYYQIQIQAKQVINDYLVTVLIVIVI